MSSIAGIVPGLDGGSENFVVEGLVDVLNPRWLHDALRESGRESVRERALPAPLALWMVVLLALFRRHSYVSLLNLLAESLWGRRHWPSGTPPTGPALTQARDRLGVEPARLLFEKSQAAWHAQTPGVEVSGHRVLAVDGSTARTPDSAANRSHFGLPPSSRGRSAYPLMRVVTLVDVGSHLTLAARCSPYRTGEVTLARTVIDSVPKGTLVVADRNFAAFEFLWDLRQSRGAEFVVRVRRTMRARTCRRLGPSDRLVRLRSHHSLRARRPDIPRSWVLREVTYRPEAGHEDIRVLTTLLDPTQAPAAEVARAYGLRWHQEGALDEIKTHLLDQTTVSRPVAFRSKSPSRVEQEFYGVLIAHNAVRMLLHRAGARTGTPPQRLSFTAALRALREAIAAMSTLPTSRLLERYDRLLQAVARGRVPLRPGRSYPREVKIKMSCYPCKGTPRRAA